MTPEMLTTLTEQVAELVQTYSNNYPQFQRATYNETQVRVDFVNRFFKLLGWDVDNERGLPQHLREVTHEATVVVEEDGVHRSKKPDFATHQGVKGLEFPRVMVILDDTESRGFLFSYEKLFGAKKQTATDLKNEKEGKDTSNRRTARLFYVACTRAMESLAVVAYSDNPELVKNTALNNGWFSEDEIQIIETQSVL